MARFNDLLNALSTVWSTGRTLKKEEHELEHVYTLTMYLSIEPEMMLMVQWRDQMLLMPKIAGILSNMADVMHILGVPGQRYILLFSMASVLRMRKQMMNVRQQRSEWRCRYSSQSSAFC